MFFDEITLSQKSWHFRLQAWMFREPPFLDNFCPYFWLTIFCLFATPFFALGLGANWAFLRLMDLLKLFDRALTYVETKICDPWVDWNIQRLNDKEVWYCYDRAQAYNAYGEDRCKKKTVKAAKMFARWKAVMADKWEARLKEIEQRVQKQVEEYEKGRKKREYEKQKQEKLLMKKRAERRRFFGKVVSWTKWIVIPIAILAVTFCALAFLYLVGFGIFKLCRLIYLAWNSAVVIHYTKILGAIILFLFLLFLMGYLIIRLAKCLAFLLPKAPFKPEKKSYWRRFDDFMFRVVPVIIAPFQLFIDYVKVFKQNNCPAIKWEKNDERGH